MTVCHGPIVVSAVGPHIAFRRESCTMASAVIEQVRQLSSGAKGATCGSQCVEQMRQKHEDVEMLERAIVYNLGRKPKTVRGCHVHGFLSAAVGGSSKCSMMRECSVMPEVVCDSRCECARCMLATAS